MGSGQALVQGVVEGKLLQTPDPNQGGTSYGSDNPAVAIPGYSTTGTPAANADAVGRLVGGKAVPVAETEVRLVKGERRIRVSGLVVDPRGIDLGAKARLTGGAWGTDSSQVVVTPAGVAKGLPTSGTVTLSASGSERTVTVVGTAEALQSSGVAGPTSWCRRCRPVPARASQGTVGPAGSSWTPLPVTGPRCSSSTPTA